MPPRYWRCEVGLSAPSRAPKLLEPLFSGIVAQHATRNEEMDCQRKPGLICAPILVSCHSRYLSSTGNLRTGDQCTRLARDWSFRLPARPTVVKPKVTTGMGGASGGKATPGRRRLLQEGANLRPHCEEFVQVGRFGEEKCVQVVRAAGFVEPLEVLRRPQHQNPESPPGRDAVAWFAGPDTRKSSADSDPAECNPDSLLAHRWRKKRNAVRPVICQNHLAIEVLSAKSFSEQYRSHCRR